MKQNDFHFKQNNYITIKYIFYLKRMEFIFMEILIAY